MSSYPNIKPRVNRTADLLNSKREMTRIPGRLWQDGMFEPLNHVLKTTGKRIRAELVDLSYRLAGGKGEVPPSLVEFVELLHAGSLVIDDIEDGSAIRRGQPTLHEEFGTPLAINTGNWMYFAALEKLQDLPLATSQIGQVTAKTITAIRRCHEGQALDLTARIDDLERRHVYPTARAISRLKTGGVTALASSLGAAVAGASPQMQQSFHAFGMQLGIALQMQNDLAELRLGSRFGGRSDDLRNARVTWPWAWMSRLRSQLEFDDLQWSLAESNPDNIHLVAKQLLDAISGVCEGSIRRKIKGAVSCLQPHLSGEDSAMLHRLVSRIEEYYV